MEIKFWLMNLVKKKHKIYELYKFEISNNVFEFVMWHNNKFELVMWHNNKFEFVESKLCDISEL